MKLTKFIAMFFIVLSCAVAAPAQEEARTTIATVEKEIAAGTATRARELALANAYLEVGRFYEARKLAQRLADQDPNDRDAAAVRDRAKSQLDAIANQRVADAEAGLKANANATDADRLELANAYFSAGRYRDAAKIYSELPNPDFDVRMKHARALSWGGRQDDAEKHYSKLLAERPSPELELEYGRLLSWMGAKSAAAQRLEHAHQGLNSEESVTALANARVWRGDRDSAIELLTAYTAQHPDAAEARTLLADLQSSPDTRLERLSRMIEQDEFNLALRAARARLNYDAGHYGRALKDIELLREHNHDTTDLAEIERLSREGQKRRLAELDEQRKTLEAEGPMTNVMTSAMTNVMTSAMTSAGSSEARAEQILELAKGYTGIGAHDQAISLYKQYLKIVPDDTRARINYARVLTWDRRYDDAQRQYEIVLREQPDRADVRLEYAQALAYDSEYVPAISTFRSLTDVSESPRAYLYTDVPARAHYSLGQIYRWYGWREHAVREQNRALEVDSTLTDARTELTRARYNTPGTMFEARYTQETNSSDFQMRRGDLEAEHWLNPRLAVQGSAGRHNFEQRGQSADASAASVGAAYRQNDRLTFRGRVGATFWDQSLGIRPYLGLGAVWLPNIQSRAALDYNHYDLIYDVSNLFTLTPRDTPSLNDPLSIDDLRGHYDYNSGGFWSALADASIGFISDDNRRTAAHGLLSFRILNEPFVAIKADGRVLSYAHRTNRYWSPEDYRSLAAVLQVGQDINDRVFWTVELKAGKSWDGDHSSDLRAWAAKVTVPVGDRFDIIGSYNYGRSGRFDSIAGDPELTTYWQRSWYVGVRLKRLFANTDRDAQRQYYFDNRVLGSDIVPPEIR